MEKCATLVCFGKQIDFILLLLRLKQVKAICDATKQVAW